MPQDTSTPEERVQAEQRRSRDATLGELLARAADHYRAQLKAHSRAIDYLKARGLSGEIAARFGLGFAPEGWRTLAGVFPRYDDPMLVEAGLVVSQEEEGDSANQKRYDRFRDRIMFPIRDVRGEVIAFGGRVLDKGEPKYLNSPETPLFVKGRELYGLFEARQGLRDKGYALVTEGYMDVVALAQLGFPNAVATLGTACSTEHVQKLLRFTERIVFSFDGDAAGRRAAGRALEAALPHATDLRSFRFLFLPPEHDPDSYVRAHGGGAFEQCVQQAVPLSRQLIEIAQVDCDMGSAEGRARSLAQARPLWMALPEGALRRQLLGELAQQAALPVAELAALWQVDRSGTGAASGARAFAPRAQRPPRMVRSAPKTPEDIAVQLLFGHAAWWEELSPDEQALLHGLPPPHGALVAWLERELAEHGPRSWAVLRHALHADGGFDAAALKVADGDADPGANRLDLRRAVDWLLARHLKIRMDELVAQAATRPEALAEYRDAERHWREVGLRLAQVREEE